MKLDLGRLSWFQDDGGHRTGEFEARLTRITWIQENYPPAGLVQGLMRMTKHHHSGPIAPKSFANAAAWISRIHNVMNQNLQTGGLNQIGQGKIQAVIGVAQDRGHRGHAF